MDTLVAAMQVAARHSSSLGREVVHVKLSEEQDVQRSLNLGMPGHYAKFLTYLEVTSAIGAEERIPPVEKVTRWPPQKFECMDATEQGSVAVKDLGLSRKWASLFHL